VVLAPCLHMPPSLHFGLKDQVRGTAANGETVRLKGCSCACACTLGVPVSVHTADLPVQ
jgi:hypothetical protein